MVNDMFHSRQLNAEERKTEERKDRKSIIISLIWIIGLITLMILSIIMIDSAHANDYIITDYGQGVFSIEHDGVIHIQGKGEAGKMGASTDRMGTSTNWDQRFSNDSEPETQVEEDLKWARKYEKQGSFENAAAFYLVSGEMGKMKEMALKDIEDDLSRNNPLYQHASYMATTYLKDKELAMEYYEKHLDQQLAREENQN